MEKIKYFSFQNHIQNILCKVNHHAAEKGHKTLRTLAGIVAFQGKSNLHDTKPQQNRPDCLDGAEHKIAKGIDGGQRVIGRKSRHGQRAGQCNGCGCNKINLFDFALAGIERRISRECLCLSF